MSADFLDLLRRRVDAKIQPHVEMYGPEAPVVRAMLWVLAEAEEIDQELSMRRVSTQEAAAVTGWSADTLQRHARARLAGEEMPGSWADLVVTGPPYSFVLRTIPAKSRAAA